MNTVSRITAVAILATGVFLACDDDAPVSAGAPALTPDQASIAVGDTIDFDAVGFTAVQWSVADTSVASISSNGRAVGRTAGTTTVRATSPEEVTAAASLQVTR